MLLTHRQIRILKGLIRNGEDHRAIAMQMRLFDQQNEVERKHKDLHRSSQNNIEFLKWLERNDLEYLARVFRDLII